MNLLVGGIPFEPPAGADAEALAALDAAIAEQGQLAKEAEEARLTGNSSSGGGSGGAVHSALRLRLQLRRVLHVGLREAGSDDPAVSCGGERWSGVAGRRGGVGESGGQGLGGAAVGVANPIEGRPKALGPGRVAVGEEETLPESAWRGMGEQGHKRRVVPLPARAGPERGWARDPVLTSQSGVLRMREGPASSHAC